MVKRPIRSRRARALLQPPGAATRGRLLDAAEELFAESGFSGVSLREIVGRADVNVAAAHYHFGSKQALFEQVFARAAQPVKERTMSLLAAAHAQCPDSLEEILRALIVPSFDPSVANGTDGANRRYGRLRAHLFLEERAFANALFKKFYAEITEQSLQGLRCALPQLGAAEIAWRFHVLLATLVFSTIPAGRVHPLTVKTYTPEDPSQAVEFLVPLLAAVFRAPPVRATRAGKPVRAARDT